jgi:acyl-CoA synthetase (AMP-forming)/AMP-acid ligase II
MNQPHPHSDHEAQHRRLPTMADAVLCALDEKEEATAVGQLRRVWIYADDGTRTSYVHRELAEEGMRWANWYRSLCVCRGEVVFIGLPMGLEYVGAVLGCILLGIPHCTVPFGTDPQASAGALNNTLSALRRIEPRLFVTTPSAVEQLRGNSLIPPRVAMHVPYAHRRVQLSRRQLPQVQPSDIHHLQLTSGSTAAPKAAILTHEAIVTNLDAVSDAMHGNVSTDRGCCWLPMYHDMGLMQLLLSVYHGGEMILQTSAAFLRNPMRWLERISEHRVTMAAAPAFAFTYCVRRYREDIAAKLDLSSWTSAGIGAERVEHRVLRDFHACYARHGFAAEAFLNCYGMAEAGFAVTMPVRAYSLTADSDPVPGVGMPLAGMEIQIRDDEGCEAAEGEPGELFMRGSSMMSGYFGDSEASAAALDGDWFRTGDLGYSRAGELFILGRRKELVILGGRNYYPQEFEQCVGADPDVGMHRSVAIGVYREISGTENLVLLVEPRVRRNLTRLRSRLQSQLRAQFGFGAAEILFLQSGGIPRTTSHKVQRTSCRGLYQSGQLLLMPEGEGVAESSDNPVPRMLPTAAQISSITDGQGA